MITHFFLIQTPLSFTLMLIVCQELIDGEFFSVIIWTYYFLNGNS